MVSRVIVVPYTGGNTTKQTRPDQIRAIITDPPIPSPPKRQSLALLDSNGNEKKKVIRNTRVLVQEDAGLPPLLPGKALVEQRKDLGDVELDIFQVKVVLVVLLHLEQIVELEVELEQATITS